MSIIAWIVLGGVAGWLASLIMDTDRSQGILANVVIGVIGALFGGFLFSTLGVGGLTGFSLYSLVIATVGAVVLIWLYQVISSEA